MQLRLRRRRQPACIVDDVRRIKDQRDLPIPKDGGGRNAGGAVKAVVQTFDHHLALIQNVINHQSRAAFIIIGDEQSDRSVEIRGDGATDGATKVIATVIRRDAVRLPGEP